MYKAIYNCGLLIRSTSFLIKFNIKIIVRNKVKNFFQIKFWKKRKNTGMNKFFMGCFQKHLFSFSIDLFKLILELQSPFNLDEIFCNFLDKILYYLYHDFLSLNFQCSSKGVNFLPHIQTFWCVKCNNFYVINWPS